MSRIGLAPISIPEKVTIAIDGNVVSVKGALGELSETICNKDISVVIEDNQIKVVNGNTRSKEACAAHGLYRQLINNMVQGVTNKFSKTLIVFGVGYRAAVQGSKLVLSLGFSHPVEFVIPTGLTVEVKEGNEKDKKTLHVTVSGISKVNVGQFAAAIRSKRPVEPYHGYGIHYSDEVVIRKEGKTSGKK